MENEIMSNKVKELVFLSDIEDLTLSAIKGLVPNAYGVKIRQRIEEEGKSISIGSIYTVLDKLEELGLVSSELGEATRERGGKKKCFYKITGAGELALSHSDRLRARLRGTEPSLSHS
jgi:PadR family transcriptional regulator, regulatory protein PadR